MALDPRLGALVHPEDPGQLVDLKNGAIQELLVWLQHRNAGQLPFPSDLLEDLQLVLQTAQAEGIGGIARVLVVGCPGHPAGDPQGEVLPPHLHRKRLREILHRLLHQRAQPRPACLDGQPARRIPRPAADVLRMQPAIGPGVVVLRQEGRGLGFDRPKNRGALGFDGCAQCCPRRRSWLQSDYSRAIASMTGAAIVPRAIARRLHDPVEFEQVSSRRMTTHASTRA